MKINLGGKRSEVNLKSCNLNFPKCNALEVNDWEIINKVLSKC